MEASDKAPAEAPERAVEPSRAAELIASGAQLVDVRADHEWDAGHIPGATHIELNELASRGTELDRSRPVIFYCRTGNRSEMPATAFGEAGYEAMNLSGGITAWLAEGHEIEPRDGKIAEPGYAQDVLRDRGSLPPPG